MGTVVHQHDRERILDEHGDGRHDLVDDHQQQEGEAGKDSNEITSGNWVVQKQGGRAGRKPSNTGECVSTGR